MHNTSVQIPHGKTLVLGQTANLVRTPAMAAIVLGKDPTREKLDMKTQMVNIYYIIRADRID